MTKKSHIVFIVPDGVGIKNYLYSMLLKHFDEYAKITIWSCLPESAFKEVRALHHIDFNYKRLQLHSESIMTRLYREAATFARLSYNAKVTQNETILQNWRRPKNNFKLGLLYRFSEFIGHWAKNKYSRILKLESFSNRYWSSKIIEGYQSDLSDLQTDSIFITHQRVAGLMPICLAAKKLGVKSTTAIFSWDNLPKARLCVLTDQYVLWSDFMKKDMEVFYKEIQSSQLKVVGTPQFEFYKTKNRVIERIVFAKKYNLNRDSHWLCFSGDDEVTSPYDPNYLNDIAEEVSKLNRPIQIIFRRCPVDFTSRYDKVLEKYKDIIIVIDPIWHTDSKTWVGYFSKVEDIDLQVNLAYHCDGVINLGSTMALDFATFNKPCLYLNYDTAKDDSWSTNFIYKYHHFKTMKNLDPVGWINSKNDISKAVISILDDKENIAKDRQQWLERIVLCPLEDNAKNIANTLL